MLFPILFVIPVVLIAAFTLIAMAVKILREYERAVVFTLGRFQQVQGAGPRGADPLHPGNGASRFAHSGHRDTDPGRDISRQRLNES